MFRGNKWLGQSIRLREPRERRWAETRSPHVLPLTGHLRGVISGRTWPHVESRHRLGFSAHPRRTGPLGTSNITPQAVDNANPVADNRFFSARIEDGRVLPTARQTRAAAHPRTWKIGGASSNRRTPSRLRCIRHPRRCGSRIGLQRSTHRFSFSFFVTGFVHEASIPLAWRRLDEHNLARVWQQTTDASRGCKRCSDRPCQRQQQCRADQPTLRARSTPIQRQREQSQLRTRVGLSQRWSRSRPSTLASVHRLGRQRWLSPTQHRHRRQRWRCSCCASRWWIGASQLWFRWCRCRDSPRRKQRSHPKPSVLWQHRRPCRQYGTCFQPRELRCNLWFQPATFEFRFDSPSADRTDPSRSSCRSLSRGQCTSSLRAHASPLAPSAQRRNRNGHQQLSMG